VAVLGSDRAGIGGLLVVLGAGFVAMLLVRTPNAANESPEGTP
jgi:MFS-type transporter involved in bile tolerance (Atg22 family)